MSEKKFYGKYRATVLNNVDPMQMGRIQVSCPSVLGVAPSSWAMPCFQVAGPQMGTWWLPSIGAGVWVEFEQGDVDFPIWSGCWFGSAAEVPALALAAPPAIPNFVIQTQGQNTIMISDLPGPTGGILLKTAAGAMISISDTGIIISNGQGAVITMNGPSVDINTGALTVI
jgi:uncharacterized protein involved in type VI secretion and phage assembly